jgi:hypothetical protein
VKYLLICKKSPQRNRLDEVITLLKMLIYLTFDITHVDVFDLSILIIILYDPKLYEYASHNRYLVVLSLTPHKLKFNETSK